VLALSFFVGYLKRDVEQFNNTVSYTDVLILPPSEPDTDFDIQPARMQSISSKLCNNTVDWKFNERLKDITFEQERICKRIISYHRYKQGEKYASLR
jgi:hypothetical protein